MKIKNLDASTIDELAQFHAKCFDEDEPSVSLEEAFSLGSNYLGVLDDEGSLVAAVRIDTANPKFVALWDFCVLEREQLDLILPLLLTSVEERFQESDRSFIRIIARNESTYLEVFPKNGYEVKRRLLQIEWNLTKPLPSVKELGDVRIREAVSIEASTLATTLVTALRPYWDWWTNVDCGGEDNLKNSYTKMFQNIEERKCWLVAEIEGKVVGLTGFHPEDAVNASFAGVMVLPEYRGRGIGKLLLARVLRFCARKDIKKLKVITVSPMDRLAPGALLYLRYGGTLTAEYIHFEKKLKNE